MPTTLVTNLENRHSMPGGARRVVAEALQPYALEDRLPEFGAGGFSLTRELAKPTKRFADRMYDACMGKSWFAGFMNAEGRKWNMSVEDWMSRMNTAVSLYIPQIFINFTSDNGLPWETLGRNVLTWFGTIWLYSFIKNDKTSLNSMFLDWFMKPDQTGKTNPDGTPFRYAYGEKAKPKEYWLKPLAKPINGLRNWWAQRPWANFVLNMQRKGTLPKGLSFDSNDLYRAAGIRVGEKGMSWSRISLEQAEKIKRMLEQFHEGFDTTFAGAETKKIDSPALKEKLSRFFDFFGHEEELLVKNYANKATGEKGLVEFARRLHKDGMKFINRYHSLTNWKTWINTLLFIFVIGDLVMRIVWATFAKLDHRGEGANRMDPNKKPKPVEIFNYRSLPARLVPQGATATSAIAVPQTVVPTNTIAGLGNNNPSMATAPAQSTPMGRQALFAAPPHLPLPALSLNGDAYPVNNMRLQKHNGGTQ